MKTNKIKRVWITWEAQRRNKTLSKLVDAELFEIITKKSRIVRYPVNFIKTLQIYISNKPDIIFAQNPSFLLATLSVLYGKISGATVVVDSHNGGIYPLEGENALLSKLAILLIRYTQITLVSNRFLSDYVNSSGGHAIVVPDPLPEIDHVMNSNNIAISKEILFVCTWASDEPYKAVIEAASLIDKRIKIYITGSSKGRERELLDLLPENIVLTGFLPDNEYTRALAACDAVMDLTNRENCLVCGAYEAVAMEKPMILSDTVALREYFHKGAIYTKHSAKEIAEAITSIYERLENLNNDVKQLKNDIQSNWHTYLQVLEDELRRNSC